MLPLLTWLPLHRELGPTWGGPRWHWRCWRAIFPCPLYGLTGCWVRWGSRSCTHYRPIHHWMRRWVATDKELDDKLNDHRPSSSILWSTIMIAQWLEHWPFSIPPIPRRVPIIVFCCKWSICLGENPSLEKGNLTNLAQEKVECCISILPLRPRKDLAKTCFLGPLFIKGPRKGPLH